MEHDEDGIGGGGDDDNVVLPIECEVCGSTDFLSEAGFYYCKLCNTQSQQSRQYIEEELAPSRTTNVRQVSVLQKGKSARGRNKISGDKVWLSTWEIFNMVLEKMTTALIGIGFPKRFRDKVFQIWSAYLLKRKVIFVTKGSSVIGRSRVSANEPMMNMCALYGMEKPKPRPMKRKLKKRVDDDDTLMGLAQARRKKTMTRKKAFETEYLLHASQMSVLDLTYEDVTGANSANLSKQSDGFNSSVVQMPEPVKRRQTRVRTEAAKRLRKIIQPNKDRFAENYKGEVGLTEFYAADAMTKVERFNLMSTLILLFVAARQVGCRVLFSDFIRLFNDGTIYVDTLKNILEDEDDDPFSKYRSECNTVMQSGGGIHLSPSSADRIDVFLDYVGIKKFAYPEFTEFLPKFIDDFSMPKEFECLVRELDTMFALDETIQDVGGHMTRKKCLVELWVLAIMVMGFKMLFGLDDVTEKYQSRFASTVNSVLARRFKNPNVTYHEKFLLEQKASGQWCELFVIEDWFKYLRNRENLLSQEVFGRECYRPQTAPNLTRANDIIQTYGDYKITMRGEDLEANKTITTMFQNLLTKNEVEITQPPTYMSMPLPKQSILNQYKSAYPKVSYPALKSSVLNWTFEKSRIDFIWNPNKYIPLLNKAGYTVKVIEGDAVNYKTKLKLKEKQLILFQPYKMFDDFSASDPSASMKFIIQMCNNIITGRNDVSDSHGSMNFFHVTLNLVSNVFMKRAMSGRVTLMDLPIFSNKT